MSWLRSPIYAWGDGRSAHLWVREDTKGVGMMDPDNYEGFEGGIHMPMDVFDAISLYRAAELMQEPETLRRAVKKARKMSGNFGAFAFLESLGEDPKGEFRRRMEQVGADRKKAHP